MADQERNRRPMKEKLAKEEGWRPCRKHGHNPTNGICPTCLRDRLALLCHDCNSTRPCRCAPSPTPSSSSCASTEPVIERDPSFRRSRSAAVPQSHYAVKGSKRVGVAASMRVGQEIKIVRSRSAGEESCRRDPEEGGGGGGGGLGGRGGGSASSGLKSCRRYLRVLMKAFRPKKTASVMQSWG